MMSGVVNRIAPVREIRPPGFSNEFVLRLHGPIRETLRMVLVTALHLLQKQQIGIEQAQMMAHFVDDQPALEERQPFVNVVSRDVQRIGHGGRARW